MTSFGSWTMAFDASSQVTRNNDCHVLTVAGVAVPVENTRAVRRSTRKLPGKWREGGLVGFKAAEHIIVGQTLPVAVTHVTRVAEDKWHAFWDEGQRQAKSLKRDTGHAANFAGGNIAIRTVLFTIIFAHMVSLVLARRGWKSPAASNRTDTVAFSAIFDTDIPDLLTREIFTQTLRHSATRDRFATFAKLDMGISARFMTEQEEPLLLLADYVAGAFNHAHPDAVLGRPVAPLKEVRASVQAFAKALKGNLRVFDHPFTEVHPLTGMR